MAKAHARLLPAGVRMVLTAASGLTGWAPVSFAVGDTAGLAMADTDTVPRGATVYTGGLDLISQRELSDSVTRIALTIPEGVGPFSVGNLILYANSLGEGAADEPFAEVVFPFAITKQIATYSGGTVDYPAPGSRLVVSLDLNHVVIQPDDPASAYAITVQVVAPEYSSLPFFDNDSNLPAPDLNPWSQFVVSTLLETGGPGLVTRRDDNTYWVLPMAKNIHHPEYGALSGGVCGDGYQVDRADWLWGGRFKWGPEVRRGQVGGIPFSSYSPQGPRVGERTFASYAVTPRS